MTLSVETSASSSASSSTSISPSSVGLASGPYQRPTYLLIIPFQNEIIEPRSGICIEPHSGICSYSDIAVVQTFLDEWVRDCVVGVELRERLETLRKLKEGKVKAKDRKKGGTVEKERSLKIKT